MPAEPTSTPTLPRAALSREIVLAAEARSKSPGFPSEGIALIREAARRLSAREGKSGDLHQAALLIERHAVVDLEVPTGSAVPGLSLVKHVLKKLMIWYLRFLGHQITAFGQCTARFGMAVANRVDGLEAEVSQLRGRLDRIEARLDDPEVT